GHIEMLLILGGNPVYDAPTDLDFAAQLQRVPQRVHLGLYADETTALCDWHLPQAHFLEAWGDARAFDGTVSIQQPLIPPLYNGLSPLECVAAIFDPAKAPGHVLVQDYWRRNWPKGDAAADFEGSWNRALHDGFIAGTAAQPRAGLQLRSNWSADSAIPVDA